MESEKRSSTPETPAAGTSQLGTPKRGKRKPKTPKRKSHAPSETTSSDMEYQPLEADVDTVEEDTRPLITLSSLLLDADNPDSHHSSSEMFGSSIAIESSDVTLQLPNYSDDTDKDAANDDNALNLDNNFINPLKESPCTELSANELDVAEKIQAFFSHKMTEALIEEESPENESPEDPETLPTDEDTTVDASDAALMDHIDGVRNRDYEGLDIDSGSDTKCIKRQAVKTVLNILKNNVFVKIKASINKVIDDVFENITEENIGEMMKETEKGNKPDEADTIDSYTKSEPESSRDGDISST